jgi:dTDP-4-amino-4,6-dideoxygalactose transaminase
MEAEYLSVFSNGTLALLIACKLLELSGEVITTPFTFPATVNALTWDHLTPVFCDIEEKTFNINPDLIEPLITERTTAIMPVHVFGNPCDVDRIQRIADRYGLKVLYDAAHAFGVKCSGKAIASFGDISMFSFHATKVYNTIEGGALVYNDPALKKRAVEMRNFGLRAEGDITEPGINAKMNEVQAAVGLLLLDKVGGEIENGEPHVRLRRMAVGYPGIVMNSPAPGVQYNYPYCAVTIDKDASDFRETSFLRNWNRIGLSPENISTPCAATFNATAACLPPTSPGFHTQTESRNPFWRSAVWRIGIGRRALYLRYHSRMPDQKIRGTSTVSGLRAKLFGK